MSLPDSHVTFREVSWSLTSLFGSFPVPVCRTDLPRFFCLTWGKGTFFQSPHPNRTHFVLGQWHNVNRPLDAQSESSSFSFVRKEKWSLPLFFSRAFFVCGLKINEINFSPKMKPQSTVSTFERLEKYSSKDYLGPIYTWRRICRRILDEHSTNTWRRIFLRRAFAAGEYF